MGSLDSNLSCRSETGDEQWEAPKQGMDKANFEASFSQQTKSAVRGCIIRNDMGMVIGSCTHPFGHVRDPNTVEALACLEAVRFVADMGFR